MAHAINLSPAICFLIIFCDIVNIRQPKETPIFVIWRSFTQGENITTFLQITQITNFFSSYDFLLIETINFKTGGVSVLRLHSSDIPHDGWEHIVVEDLGENIPPDEPIPYESCEICGNEQIRYVHILRHPDYEGEIRVGRICASRMIGDNVTPFQKENALRNRINRRERFLQKEWRYKPETGNYTLRFKGKQITIMRSRYGSNLGVIFDGKSQWKYRGSNITDFNTAKIVAFNMIDDTDEL